MRGDVKEATKGMPAVLKWEDPPYSRHAGSGAGRGGRPADSMWNGVAEQLRDERGRWALIYQGERKPAMAVRTFVTEGRRVCFRPVGDFEACMRSWGGVHFVYARYMGEGGE